MAIFRLSGLAPLTTNLRRVMFLKANPFSNFNSSTVRVSSKYQVIAIRNNYSKAGIDEPKYLLDRNPEDVAKIILSRFPGYTVQNKTCSVLVMLSILMFLLSKEWIIVEAMTGEIYSFILASFIWYKMVGQTVREFIQTKRKNVGEFMNIFKIQHKEYFKDRVLENKRISELPEISAALHEMSRELIRMRAQTYKLKQINQINETVKTWLDANVSYEFTVRNSVQNWVASRVLNAVTIALKQPQTKNEILKDAIMALEEFAKTN